MVWPLLAVLSAATFAMVSVMDKQLVSKYMPTLPSFYITVGMSVLLWGTIALTVFPLAGDVSLWPVVAALVSGLMWGLGVMLLFLGLKLEEASRAVAVYHTFPVFVAILAVIFLGEELIPLHWLAILVTVAGATLISLRESPGRHRLSLNRVFLILLTASLLTAGAQLTSKYALEHLSLWNAYGLRNLGLAIPFLLALRPRTVRDLARAVRNRTALYLLVASEFILVPFSVVITLLSISLGPVSLVSTIIAVRPFFVFVYTTLLSTPWWRVMDEPLRRETLLVKFVSIAMIIGGISAITLL